MDTSEHLLRGFPSLLLHEKLRESADIALFRGRRAGDGKPVLAVLTVQDRPATEVIERLEHEFSLRDELALPWAAAPSELLRHGGRLALVLMDPGGVPLASCLEKGEHRLSVAEGLRLGTGLAASMAQVHARGLIHKDLKPEHILVEPSYGSSGLTGFGLAARLSREWPEARPPEALEGTLAYMAPEQTGRMNRGIDARSDLYAFGVVLYEALTGRLPFTATDPLEILHSHIARLPAPPAAQDPSVPALLSDLVLKLLAKTPEERYQTARGVEADLRRCLAAWETLGRLDPFPLAEHDQPERPLAPVRLYGRKEEARQLLDAWERVAAGAGPELVLVAGYAGVGKSSLVNGLLRAIVPARGIFASGKCDQYQRWNPYSALAEAFRSLLRRMLAGPEEELAAWKGALAEAMGSNGNVLAEMLPELVHLLGPLPPVPELAPAEARNRYRAVFTGFLRALAAQEHPLVLFLDDIQWLEPASLELVAHLLANRGLRHLLFVGAYRDNEVDGTHPLVLAVESIRGSGGPLRKIELAPLAYEHVLRVTADMLLSPPGRVEPLARLIQEKTGGNPFFAHQFLISLYEEGLLAFQPDTGRWTWDLARVAAKGYTDNVVDLMARKLTRRSEAAREALKAMAVLGMQADVDLIARAVGTGREQVLGSLAEAEQAGLLVRADGGSRAFVHDRIREAAYSLIPPGARPGAHLRMGRLLLAGRGEEEVGEDLFELAGHFNQGLALIEDPGERELIRRLDLRAARKAKAAGAYVAARNCLVHAQALLPADAWRTRYEDAIATLLELSETEFLTGRFEPASRNFEELLRKAKSPLDRAAVHRLRIRLFQVSGKHAEAVATGLEALRLLGVEIPEEPEASQAAAAEITAIRTRLAGQGAAVIASLPEITDPEARHHARMVLDLMTEIRSSAYAIARPYHDLFILKAVSFCLQHGNIDAGCMAFSGYATMLANVWGDVETAVAISSMSVALNERYRDARRRPALVGIHATVVYWVRPIAVCRSFMEEAFGSAINVGDYVYGGYAASAAGWLAIESGMPLRQARAEMKPYLEFASSVRNEVIRQTLRLYEQFLACLEGATLGLSSFDDDAFKEEEYLAAFRRAGYTPAITFFLILKQFATFLLGRYEEALEHAMEAARLRGGVFVMPIYTMGHFLHALTLAALHADAPPARKASLAKELEGTLPLLKSWSEHCPETFLGRYQLVCAEKARIEGRDLEAIRLYEQAIASARENGFLHVEGIACESAARFYLGRELGRNAAAHLQEARACYLRWGATAKVAQLDSLHPGIAKPSLPGPTATTLGTPHAQIDLFHMIKASQSVSGEIELGKLVETLLRLLLEQAGADRGLLILPGEEGFSVEAEAVTGPEGLRVRLPRAALSAGQLSEAVFRYVVRTNERVLLDEASASELFAEDGYLQEHKPRSLLCLPLLKQARLVGVLYLENRLAAGAFTPSRVSTLEVLASQAAISLENARLYATLGEERTRLQAVIAQVPVGLIIAEAPSGRFLIANDKARDILRQTPQDSASKAEYAMYQGFHPDGRRYEPDEWPLARALRTGETVSTEEIEMLWADGTQGWLSVGAAPINDAEGRTAAAVTVFQDITGRRRREEALKASEQRFAKAFHNNPTAMAILRRKDWVFVEVNEGFLSLLGYRRDEVVGHFCLELGIWFRELLEQAGRSLVIGHPFRGEEFAAVDKAGESKALLVSVDVIELSQENCFLASFVDLTERKHVEEQLRQSQKMEAIGSLAGGVAHDFNNLLTAINGYSELVMMGMEDSDPRRDLVNNIRLSGERAAGLTRQLLAFSRKEQIETRVQGINVIVGEMEKMLRRLIEEHVALHTRLDPEAGLIDADRGQVEQILLNLVVNARDAMPQGGEIRVETQRAVVEHPPKEALLPVAPGPYVTLTVRDTGTGMSPEVRNKMFEPFFTTKGIGKGTGLGLAVVYGIMKRLGGGIVVHSTPGRGTTFRIFFPEAKEQKAQAVEKPKSAAKAMRGRERILVVEDELGVRTYIRQALAAQGYQVLEAGNGLEALQVLEREAVDLVLTDLIMPDLGGPELAERVRESSPDLPILYTSGYSRDVGAFQEMLANGEHFLAKPFGPVDLVRKVREILDKPRNLGG